MYETQEWEMDGVSDNHIGVTAVSVTKSHKSLAAAHVPYAHEHIYAWNIMAQNNNIAVQVVAHVIVITAMGVRLHVRRQYSHAMALP